MTSQRAKHLRLIAPPPDIDLAPIIAEVNAMLLCFDDSTPSGKALREAQLVPMCRRALWVATWMVRTAKRALLVAVLVTFKIHVARRRLRSNRRV
jgi:hypothetical protein